MIWQQKEVELLRQNFPKISDKSLAQTIGRSPNALRIMASRLGITRGITTIRENLELNSVEMQVVIGGLLGDLHSTIGKTSKYARLQGAHSGKQKGYLLWKAELLRRLHFKTREAKSGVYRYDSKSFKALNVYHSLFYNSGKKKVSRKILDLLDDFGLLIWYLDDGSFHRRDKTINLHTNGFSFEEQLLMKNWFKEKYSFNLKIYQTKQPKEYPGKVWYFLHLNAKDSEKLLAMFKSFQVPPCMKYKLGEYPTPLLSSETDKVKYPVNESS